MYLERVHIENIRSLSSLELNFADPDAAQGTRRWSLIAGENGSGKTTMLKAIGLALAGSDSLHSLIDEPGTWVRDGCDEGHIHLIMRSDNLERREISLSIRADEGVSSLIRRNTEGLEMLDSALQHASQNYFVVAYGPYRRLSQDPSFLSKESAPVRAQSMATMFDSDRPLFPIQTWAMRLEYRDGEEGLEIVRNSINALLPGIEFDGIDRRAETLIFRTPDGLVPLERLSDGYQNVAAWIGDLLYRVTEAFAHHKNPLQARGILLIDEIDAHLHPSWQRQLRNFLDATLPNFQIIATTHSALTLQQSHEDDAIVLARDESGVVKASPFPGDPSKLRLHQIYDLAFKISSLDSWEVQQSKDVYRKLSGRKESELDAEERQRLAEAREVLEILPESSAHVDAAGNAAMEKFFEKLEETTSQITKQTSQG